MARLSDLKLTYWLYMKGYIYRSFDWRPGTRLEKPLSESKIAVVSTAGFHLPDQPPFDETIRGGDYSYRTIPANVGPQALQISHRSDAFDEAALAADRNVAFPLDRLQELARQGHIGAVAPVHFSFQGSIPAPTRLVKLTAPEVAEQLRAGAVDGVLLTPV